MTFKLLLISRGERPRTPCDATRGDERMGEVNRVLPGSRKSAEPIKAGQTGTSDPVAGPASKPAMARETEPMVDASSETGTCQLGSGRVGTLHKRRAGGVLVRAVGTWTGGAQLAAHQPRRAFALRRGRIPHGVESAPKAGERSVAEPKNLTLASGVHARRMAEATSDRGGEGRSLRSSPGTGKPSTWRRKAVDTAGRQEVDPCPTR